MMRSIGGALVFTITLGVFAVNADETPVRILPGAIEVGLSGAWTSAEDARVADLGLHSGWFFALGPGVASAELGLGYEHISSLDAYDLEALMTWQRALPEAPIYPFIAIGAGVRHESIGSFSQTRYPVGGAIGLRVLAGTMAGVRMAYRYRRVLDDPVADFSESELRLGLSLYLRNRP